MEILRQNYEGVTTSWSRSLYVGITLDWDYAKRQVHLPMPDYIKRALVQFQHELPEKCTFTIYPYIPPSYGKTVQMAKQASLAPKLSEKKH